MDALYQTPLLDCVRRGEVAADIRMLAAQGVLAPRPLEQLALLAWLVNDTDPAIRHAAETTLSCIPPSMLARFLANPDLPDDLLDFFAGRGIIPDESAGSAEEPELFATEDQHELQEDAVLDERSEATTGEGAQRLSTVQRLSAMSVTEKVKAAMRGNREARSLLIRDSNKLVSIAVLASPRLTEQEVETYARMASMSEDVLRVIGTTRAWIKNYMIVRALTSNPKTPIAISMGMVNRLLEKDVKALASDRNIAEPVKALARKMMQAGQSRKR
jgi:hypothetical protein